MVETFNVFAGWVKILGGLIGLGEKLNRREQSHDGIKIAVYAIVDSVGLVDQGEVVKKLTNVHTDLREHVL